MFSNAQFMLLTQDGVAAQLAAVQLVQRHEQRPVADAVAEGPSMATTPARRTLPLFRRLRLATS
ncbi:MAG: hypothetical protein JWQ99_3176 [Blastococcus sp.]|jgi:hypothetical protein|nr:hypothetical protein [Blastococcus sp.]